MPRVEFDMETTLRPERVIGALTDFTEKRPDIWPGLSRTWYEVYSVEQTSAEIREGTGGPRSSVWAKEHYDWSTPGLVTWTVRESGFCAPGSFVSAKVDSKDGAGSKVHVTWERQPTNMTGRIAAVLIKLTHGMPVKASIKRALRKLEQKQAGET